jgi:chorismate mutase
MQLNKRKLAFVAAWLISGVGTVYPQRVTDHLHRLVEMSARRLAIAEQIALAKWDSGTPVEDASREAQVIASAVKAGESRGLDQATVSSFFRAQIEASKLVQYSLLAEWRRLGKAPDHAGQFGQHDSSAIGSTGNCNDCRIGENVRHPWRRVMSRRHREGGGRVCVDT